MTDQRISCPRKHQLFRITAEGIAIKCRAGECRQVYIIPWAELDKMRQEMAECAILSDKQSLCSSTG